MAEDRCLRTKNLYGTDTEMVGKPCPCSVCRLTRERDEAIALATAMKTASVIAIGERDAALESARAATTALDAAIAQLKVVGAQAARLRALLREVEPFIPIDREVLYRVRAALEGRDAV